jgi:hypothetical protein
MKRSRRMLMWVAVAIAAFLIVSLFLWGSIDITAPR